MIRKKRTYRATDEDYQMFCAVAELQGRSVSEFILQAGKSEAQRRMKRIVATKGFRKLVSEIVSETLKNHFHHVGNQHSANIDSEFRSFRTDEKHA